MTLGTAGIAQNLLAEFALTGLAPEPAIRLNPALQEYVDKRTANWKVPAIGNKYSVITTDSANNTLVIQNF
jgi:hypothetical protein